MLHAFLLLDFFRTLFYIFPAYGFSPVSLRRDSGLRCFGGGRVGGAGRETASASLITLKPIIKLFIFLTPFIKWPS
jgi:hypothetical protein